MYIHLLKNGFLEASPVKTGFTNSEMEIISESVILVDPQAESLNNPSFYHLERSITKKLNDPSGIIPIDSGFNEIRYITREGLIDTLIINNGLPGNVLSMAELVVRSLINYQAGKKNIYFTKGMQEKYQNIFQNEELTDLGLLYELGNRKVSTIKFNGQLYDTTLLRNLIQQKNIRVDDPSFFARIMIHNLVLEAEIILILMESDPFDYEKTYTRLFNFILDHPVNNSGINYYYIFALDELYRTENYRNKAIEYVRDFVSELSELISDTKILDDDFRDISQLKFYQSIITTLRSNESLITEAAVNEDIELIEKVIYDKLLEFPELNFN
jgi:hypothetical protein